MKRTHLLSAAVFACAPCAAAAACLDLSSARLASPPGALAARFAPSSGVGGTTLEVSPRSPGRDALVLLPVKDLRDGEIRLRLKSELAPDAPADARGFAGLAFRIAGSATAFEYFYVRPSNARADDQVRRNHSLQYASHPNHPWQVLRKTEPGKYESYADMGLGEWIDIRAVFKDQAALFYVNGARHPSLLVKDLKLAAAPGAIGLWVGPGTRAHFADVCHAD